MISPLDDIAVEIGTRESLAGPSAADSPAKFRGLEKFVAGDMVTVKGKFDLSMEKWEAGIRVRALYYASSVQGHIIRGLYLGWRFGRAAYAANWSRFHFFLVQMGGIGTPGSLMPEMVECFVVLDESEPWPLEAKSFDVEFNVLSEGRCFT